MAFYPNCSYSYLETVPALALGKTQSNVIVMLRQNTTLTVCPHEKVFVGTLLFCSPFDQ